MSRSRVSMPSIEAISKPPAARREGSPWTGLGAVFLKEFADHLGGARMRVLVWLVLVFGMAAVDSAIQDPRSLAAPGPLLFLPLVSLAREPLPSLRRLPPLPVPP